jgi:undecaprenyl-diphosphatase
MLSKELTAFVLGIVEGLTEYIPVSSTGHLILVGNVLGFSDDKAKLFEIFIQLGAILAIVVLYPRFFMRLIPRSGEERGQGFEGIEGIKKLAIGALPVFIVGFLAHDFIKSKLFNPTTVAAGLIAGSFFILYAEFKNKNPVRKTMSDLSYKDCLIVGIFQCFSLWPGVSRAGATIVGGLLAGFERRLAAEFSFLLAVPVLTVAVAYDVYKNRHLIMTDDAGMFAIGFVTSFFVALLAVKFFLNFLKNKNFKIFAYYRIVLAILVLSLL